MIIDLIISTHYDYWTSIFGHLPTPIPLVRRVYQEVWQPCTGEGFADRRGKPTCPFCSSRFHMENPGWSPSSDFSQDGVPGTAAVSSYIFSFNLSWALKLQLPGICSLWLLQREKLFEKRIPGLWTITHVKEVMKSMHTFYQKKKENNSKSCYNF